MGKRVTVIGVCLSALLPAGPAGLAAQVQAVLTKPVVICSFDKAKTTIQPGVATAAGKCLNTKTHKPVPAMSITWTQQVAGLGGTPCSLTPSSGKGGVARFAPAQPESVAVTFTLRPTGAGKAASITLSPLINNDSKDVCGVQPQIVTSPASAAQDRCTWGEKSTLSPTGQGFLGGRVIQCPGAWDCEWVKGLNLTVAELTYWNTGEIRCHGKDQNGVNLDQSKYRVYIRNNVYYSAFTWTHSCRIPYSDQLDGATAFGVPHDWKGFVFWSPDLISQVPSPLKFAPADTDLTFAKGVAFNESSTRYRVPFSPDC
jgi:hypothetical protein